MKDRIVKDRLMHPPVLKHSLEDTILSLPWEATPNNDDTPYYRVV